MTVHSTPMKADKHIFIKIAGIMFWLILWQLFAMSAGSKILLASPWDTLVRLTQLIPEPDFIRTALNSFLRISAGFFTGLIAGILLGALSVRFKAAQSIISPVISVIKSVPVASFIILALFWIKSTELSWFISFLIVLPIIYGSIREGVTAVDDKLREAADMYSVSTLRKIRFLYFPAVMPSLSAACTAACGLAFKSGAAAEVIGQPDFTIGDMLYRAKIYLETADLFAWTVVIIILSKLLEALVSLLLKLIYRRTQRIG